MDTPFIYNPSNDFNEISVDGFRANKLYSLHISAYKVMVTILGKLFTL